MSVTDPSVPDPTTPAAPDPTQPAAPAAPDSAPAAPAAPEPTPTPDPSQPATPDPAPAAPAAPPPPAVLPETPPSPQDAAPVASTGDQEVSAELDAMRSRMAELEAKLATGQLTIAQTDTELAQKVTQLRQVFDTWPAKGPEFADTPQPWDLQAHGLPQPGVTRDHLPPGEPDEISPVVVAHNKPLLTAGMAGDAVADLADLLKKAGYSTSISEGHNHANAFDATIATAVNTFKRDFHVLEDPSQWPQDARMAERFVGPYVWEALIRVAKLAEKALVG